MAGDFRLRNLFGDPASFRTIGDLNGDGFDDYLIGFGQTFEGFDYLNAYVLEGAASPADSLLFGQDNPYYDERILTSVYGAGASPDTPTVIAAGDLNGDGFDDLLVLGRAGADASGYAPYGGYGGYGYSDELYSGAVTENGRPAYVIFGAAEFGESIGITDGPERSKTLSVGVTSAAAGALISYNTPDIVLGRPEDGDTGAVEIVTGAFGLGLYGEQLGDLTLTGEFSSDMFGEQVDIIEPIDYRFDPAFLLVSAPGADPAGRAESGRIYVISSFALADFDPDDGDVTLALSDIDPSEVTTINGPTGGANLGFSAAAIGDVNGDGQGDIAVAAYDPLRGGAVELYVLFADRNSGGFTNATNGSNAIDLVTLSAEDGIRLTGFDAQAGDIFTVTALGDVSGDGFDDFAVALPGDETNSGSVVLVLGSYSSFWASSDVSALNYGYEAFRFEGGSGDRAGLSVERLGDYNGDGFGDFSIGTASESYVILGGFGMLRALDNQSAGYDGTIRLSDVGKASGATYLSVSDDDLGLGPNGTVFAKTTLTGNDASFYAARHLQFVEFSASENGFVTVQFDSEFGRAIPTDAGRAALLALRDGEELVDRIEYTVTDGVETGTATVTFTATGVEDAPIAGDDLVFTSSDSDLLIDVLANDADPEGGALTLKQVSGAQFGSVSIEGGQVRYVPGTDFETGDSFTYAVIDDTGFEATATVDVGAVGSFPMATVRITKNPWSRYFDLAQVGDTDGDGVSELLLGSPLPNGPDGQERAGLAVVVSGFQQGVWPLDIDLDAAGEALWAETVYGGRGYRVAAAGDVNGDGLNDLGFGSEFSLFFQDPGGFGRSWGGYGDGASGVIFGRADGPLAASLDDLGDGGITLRAPGTSSLTEGFDAQLVGVGDLDGDGFDDVVVTLSETQVAPSADSQSALTSRMSGSEAYIIWGRPGGGSELTVGSSSASLRLADTVSTALRGAPAGDVNGDGVPDILLSGFRQDTADGHYYDVNVIFGDTRGALAGLDLDNLDGSDGFTVRADSAEGFYGSTVHTTALGDMNGDGLGDFAVSLPFADNAGSGIGTGAIAVIYGGVTDPVLNLGDLDGSNGYLLHGSGAGQYVGASMASAGDFDGDGLDDLLVAYGDTITVVYGTSDPVDARRDLTTLTAAEALSIKTEYEYNFSTGRPLAGGTDLDGDGRDDISFGDGRDTVRVIFGGRVEVLDVLDGALDGQADVAVLEREVPPLPPVGNDDGGDDGGGSTSGPQSVSVSSGGFVAEGDADGDQVAIFTLIRSGDVSGTMTVDYELRGAGTEPVSADDVLPGLLGTGQMVFGDGQTTRQFQVPIAGDLLIEADEMMELEITAVSVSSGGDASIGTASAHIVVVNDDQPAILAARGGRVTEGDGGTRTLLFAIERSGGVKDAVDVTWRIEPSGDNPIQNSDLGGALPLLGITKFQPGQTRIEVPIVVNGDLDIEPDETMELRIESATSASGNPVTIAEPAAMGTVETDDFPPRLEVSGANVLEGDTGNTQIDFTILRFGGEGQTIDVEYLISSGDADAADATPIDIVGSLTLGPDDFADTVPITVFGDFDVEADETITLEILSAETTDGIAADISAGSADVLIRNDDEPAVFSVEAAELSMIEGNSGRNFAEFVVTRAGETDNAVTLGWSAIEELQASRTVDQLVRVIDIDNRVGQWWEQFVRFEVRPGAREVTTGSIIDTAEAPPLDGSDVFKTLRPTFSFDEIAVADLDGGGLPLDIPSGVFRVLDGGATSNRDGAVQYDLLWPQLDLEVGIDTPTLGDVSMNYPIQTALRSPGYVVTGETAFVSSDGARAVNPILVAESLNFGSIDVDLAFSAGEIGAKNVELSTFFGIPLATFDDLARDVNDTDKLDLFTISPGFGGDGEGEREIFSMFGSLPGGNKAESQNLGGTSVPALQADVFDPLLGFSVDLLNLGSLFPMLNWIKFLSGDLDEPIKLGRYELTGEYALADADISLAFNLKQSFTFLPDIPSVTISAGSVNSDLSFDESVGIPTAVGQSEINGTATYSFGGAINVVTSLVPVLTLTTRALQAALTVKDTITGVSAKAEFGPLIGASPNIEFDPLLSFEQSYDVSPDIFDPVSFDFSIPVVPSAAPEDSVLFGSVTFEPGETQKTIRIPVQGDRIAEVDGDIVLRLDSANAMAGEAELRNDEARITVLDNDNDFVREIREFWPRLFGGGDPHLVTADGLSYSFMAVGEFTLLEAIAGSDFILQARMSPQPGSDLLSVITAMATEIDGHRITFNVLDDERLTIDGEAVSIPLETGFVSVGAGRIVFDGETYTFVQPSQERIFLTARDGYIDLEVAVDPARDPGEFRGLLGNVDGDMSNDLALPDGTVLEGTPSFDTLYKVFAEAWRLTDDTTLFEYAAGLSTADFTDRGFPRANITLDDLPSDLLAAATAAVDAAEIPDGPGREAAILDFALTGDPQFIASQSNISPTAATKLDLTDAPGIGRAVGITTTGPVISEGDEGDLTDATFRIVRLGDVSEALTLALSRTGTLSADELLAGPPLEVTLAAGQDRLDLAFSVIGDDLKEADETLGVEISIVGEIEYRFLSPFATVTVADDDRAPLPAVSVATETPTVMEGDGNPTKIVFTLSRDQATAEALDVRWAVVAAQEHSPVSDEDFSGGLVPAGTARFEPSELSTEIHVSLAGDMAMEPLEGFALRVLDGDGYRVAVRDSAVLIEDDDINQAPVAAEPQFTAQEDKPRILDLSNDITDPEALPLHFDIPEYSDQGGTLRNLGGGLVEYTPTLNFVGSDEFLVSATDSGGLSVDDVLIAINVEAFNSAPVARDDGQAGSSGFAVSSRASLLLPDLLENDFDADPGDTLVLSGVFDEAALGLVQLLDDGRVFYDPANAFDDLAAGDVAFDTFSYEVRDAAGLVDRADVVVRIQAPVEDGPVATGDSASVAEDGSVLIDVLDNDSDADGDTLSMSAIVTGPANGTAALESGQIRYTANADFSGEDSFTYEVSDGNGGTDTATVMVTVTAVNDAPVAFDAGAGTDEDTAILGLSLAINVFDIDSSELVYALKDDATSGTVTIAPNGQMDFFPDADLNGETSFTYTVTDPEGLSAEARFTIDVAAVNDAPVLPAHGPFKVAENGTEAGVITGSDVDGDALEYAISGGADAGLFAIDAVSGALSFKAAPDFESPDSAAGTNSYEIEVSASDGLLSAETTIAVTVTDTEEAGNTAPVANDDTFIVTAGETLTVSAPGLLENDTDTDADVISVLVVEQSAELDLDVQQDGSFAFTPEAGFSGPVTFTYRAFDGTALSEEATVTITVEDPVLRGNPILGTVGRDILHGTAEADEFFFNGGLGDIAFGNGGDDVFNLAANLGNGLRDITTIRDFSAGDNLAAIDLAIDADPATVRSFGNVLMFQYGPDGDLLSITGEVDGLLDALTVV